MELLLLAACWWHLTLIQGNLAMAYYSKTAVPPEIWDDGKRRNRVQHLILNSSEAVLLTAIVSETMNFFNLFAKEAKQGEDNAEDAGLPWEPLKDRSLSASAINSNNGMFISFSYI